MDPRSAMLIAPTVRASAYIFQTDKYVFEDLIIIIHDTQDDEDTADAIAKVIHQNTALESSYVDK